MFFFIGGIQPKTKVIEKQYLTCPYCGYSEVYRKRVDHYLSLFFIPLFPVKRGEPFLSCENCKSILDQEGRQFDFSFREKSSVCHFCGKKLQHDFHYCPYCGKFVNDSG